MEQRMPENNNIIIYVKNPNLTH